MYYGAQIDCLPTNHTEGFLHNTKKWCQISWPWGLWFTEPTNCLVVTGCHDFGIFPWIIINIGLLSSSQLTFTPSFFRTGFSPGPPDSPCLNHPAMTGDSSKGWWRWVSHIEWAFGADSGHSDLENLAFGAGLSLHHGLANSGALVMGMGVLCPVGGFLTVPVMCFGGSALALHFGTGIPANFRCCWRVFFIFFGVRQVTSIIYTLKSLFWAMALLMLIIFVFSVLSLGTAREKDVLLIPVTSNLWKLSLDPLLAHYHIEVPSKDAICFQEALNRCCFPMLLRLNLPIFSWPIPPIPPKKTESNSSRKKNGVIFFFRAFHPLFGSNGALRSPTEARGSR